MPYIKQEDRARLLTEMVTSVPEPVTAGELNYLFTCFAHDYWKRNGQNYQAFNDIIGALEGVKLELYRRRVAPYEDAQITKNGDV